MYCQKRLFPLVSITLLLKSLFNYQSPDYFLAIDIASMKDDKNFMFALISCHKCFTDSQILIFVLEVKDRGVSRVSLNLVTLQSLFHLNDFILL